MDPSVVCLNVIAKTQESRVKSYDAILKLAAGANLAAGPFGLIGDLNNARFEIQWKGSSKVASEYCLSFYSSLRLDRGEWKLQNASGYSGQLVQFFINPDKNGAMVWEEVLAKQLMEIVQPR